MGAPDYHGQGLAHDRTVSKLPGPSTGPSGALSPYRPINHAKKHQPTAFAATHTR